VDPELQKTLDLLREIASEPIPTGPVELDPNYLRAVRWQEALPRNESGTAKDWVRRILEDSKRHFERIRASRRG
jgi:hypothetical protein